MQRVPLAEFDPVLQKRLEELWGKPVNLYRALGNHPPLTAAWTEFANAIRHESRTPRALRELMILRTAQVARSEYEWAQHLRMARKAGSPMGTCRSLRPLPRTVRRSSAGFKSSTRRPQTSLMRRPQE